MTSIFEQAEAAIRRFDESVIDKSLETAEQELADAGIERTCIGNMLTSLKPANYVIKGLLVRGYVYALTAGTGTGKTTLMANMAVSVAHGKNFGPFQCKPGRVLYLAGENPPDVLFKVAAAAQTMLPGAMSVEGMAEALNGRIDIIDKAFSLMDMVDYIVKAYQDVEYDLVIVDTSQAYFGGTEANSNTDQKDHALAMRRLSQLRGSPCVVVPCHPTKGNSTLTASSEVTPYGGGSFLNEVDGNLTLCRDTSAADLQEGSTIISLHWYLKLRQTPFDAVKFILSGCSLPAFLDEDGKATVTVTAKHINTMTAERVMANTEDKKDRVLILLSGANLPNGGAITQGGIAGFLGVNQSTISRLVLDLRSEGLVAAKGLKLTPAGRSRAREAKGENRA